MDAGSLDGMLDGVKSDDCATETVVDAELSDARFNQKSEVDPRLQLCVFGLVSVLKAPFLGSWKHAPAAPLVVLFSDFGLKACSLSAFG